VFAHWETAIREARLAVMRRSVPPFLLTIAFLALPPAVSAYLFWTNPTGADAEDRE
jgi:hypothetical protein